MRIYLIDMEGVVTHLENTKKSHIREHNIDLYESVIEFSKGISEKMTWGRMLWHYIHNVHEIPKCVCGDILKFKCYKQGYRNFCSNKCVYDSDIIKDKRKETCVIKYGVDNPSKNDDIRKKIENTNISKYGEKYPLQNKKMMRDVRDTFLSNHGVDNPSKLESVKIKRQETINSRYGNENYFKTEDYLIKSMKTKIEKYGDKNYNNRDKFKKTQLERHGDENYNNITQIRKTNLEKYGKEFFSQTEEYKKIMSSHIDEQNKEYFDQYGIKFSKWLSHDRVILECSECEGEYETTKQLFRKRIIDKEIPCLTCNPINYSKTENDLKDFIDSLNIKFIENDRTILGGKEIDIYLPDLKIGIEFNGLYWHSDLFKDRKYHYDKMILSNNNNIKLIQIWEDQWMFKRDIVESMVKYKLGMVENKIYARKCVIKEVDYNTTKSFLYENHIQGHCNSSMKYGLYYNDTLVGLMTFGKLRKNLGQKSEEGSYELLRFCNKLNTSVVGGFSKLLSYFKKNNEYEKLISYAMCDYSNGNVYEKNGFKFDKFTGSNYYYYKNKVRYNRYNFRKDVLVKEGYDSEKTEREIMNDRGYNRIYDSGSMKYILLK